jgi:hypothetical protein
LLFGDSESFESEDVRFWEGRRSKVPTSHVNRSCALDHISVCSTVAGAAWPRGSCGGSFARAREKVAWRADAGEIAQLHLEIFDVATGAKPQRDGDVAPVGFIS